MMNGAVQSRAMIFYRALLKIWIGEHPVSSSLKNGMLGIQD